jgi:hypothetical protein
MKRLSVVLVLLALIAAPCFAQGADTDADGITDAVEQELGTDLHRAEEYTHQWHDGAIGEDDESVNRKFRCAIMNGIAPIICIGETAEQKHKGMVHDIL